MDDAQSSDHYRYRIKKRYVPLWFFWGLRPRRDGVTITSDELLASFGWAKIKTPLANIDGAHVTARYRWWKAIGVRLSFVDDGLTFGTCCSEGVCIHFREKVPSFIPRKKHSAITVTVTDCGRLLAHLQELAASGS